VLSINIRNIMDIRVVIRDDVRDVRCKGIRSARHLML
jgi:hypothetical protein